MSKYRLNIEITIIFIITIGGEKDLMVSKEMKGIINLLNAVQKNLKKKLSVNAIRTAMDQLGTAIKLPKVVKCDPVDAGGVPAEWIIPPNAINQNIIYYLHGGGYIAGSIKVYRDLAMRIARVSNARALIINYRLAPEHPFPAALEDATKAYQWLIDSQGISPNNLIIAGDSAGGGLALATLINLRDKAISLPSGAVCLSPLTDLANTGDSVKNNAKTDPFIFPELTDFCAKLYLDDADKQNPLGSPLYANLQDLPPIFIQVGTTECILDDSIRFEKRAKEAGVNVQLEIWKDMIHIFAYFAALAPESRQAIDQIGNFTQKFFK